MAQFIQTHRDTILLTILFTCCVLQVTITALAVRFYTRRQTAIIAWIRRRVAEDQMQSAKTRVLPIWRQTPDDRFNAEHPWSWLARRVSG